MQVDCVYNHIVINSLQSRVRSCSNLHCLDFDLVLNAKDSFHSVKDKLCQFERPKQWRQCVTCLVCISQGVIT